MLKKIIAVLCSLCLCATMFAQGFTGGVKGTVVNRAGRVPVPQAELQLSQNGEVVASARSAADGSFSIGNLDNGRYDLQVTAVGFLPITVNVTVDGGFVKDLIFVSLTASQVVEDVDDSSFAEFDMDDSGYTDTPTILFGQSDPYTNLAGYGFSAIRFKNRGYDSETQDVYLSGIKLNDALSGYSPFSLWSGLNEAMRSKESTIGSETADFGVGGVNGQTNILGTPSQVRPGWRFSVLTNSAMYRLRLMGTYASGELDNGWSYAFNVSARVGGNDWVEGVYYRNFAYYAGVEKKIGDVHRISLVTFAAPGQRGAQNASTQEVYDLMGDNMYNSNWGYQNGKVRNSRVRKTFEPVTVLKYTATPMENLEASATVLWRTGMNGYTALDWYDAADPRPDYYRNLPSYFYLEDEDYNRVNQEKYDFAYYQWTSRGHQYENYQHLNWDRLYNVNYNNPEGRSKYALEERHVDQNDLNFAANVKWRQSDLFTLTGGLTARINRTENYKKLADLLGGQYYLNIDSFAERDFASDEVKLQNDLDYYEAHGEAQKITKGMKYGYDYLAQVRNVGAWANGTITKGGLTVNVAGSLGYDSFWREGLVKKGLFPDNSKGKSAVSRYLTGSAKASVAYVIKGGHRVSANAAFLSDAPTFNQSFVSARTRNTLVTEVNPEADRTRKTMAFDVNYQLNASWMQLRATAYYSRIFDQNDVMSFYDDSQNSFTNFAMSGIAERHMGVELGVKVPLPVKGLSVSGVFTWGDNIYVKNRGKDPYMVQTIDNSAEIVRSGYVPFWVSHNEYKKEIDDMGNVYYWDNPDGTFIVDKKVKHYVPSSPQIAGEIALNYRTNSYWFFELNAQFFAKSYLDMNPLYRTDYACAGADGILSPAEEEYMAAQESLFTMKDGSNPAFNHFLLNASVGKSWYIQRKYNFGFSLEVKNMTNNTWFKTGGYEQTRLISSVGKDRYYRFDPKYFYMQGVNYMLNLYLRF
ncbi:MAG: TonB-dependent receptor [Bacteroidales bacterium]|nr:TonB-dependent receptor [Bacteroidales bacterium]